MAVVTCASALAGGAEKGAIAEWQARYDKGAQVYAKKDADGLANLLAPDWKDISSSGKVLHRGKSKDPIVAEFNAMKSMSAKFTVTDVKLKGIRAIIKRKVIIKCRMVPGADKVEHDMLYTSAGLETWTKMDGKWLISESRALTENMTIDGKPRGVHGHMPLDHKHGH